MKYYQEQPVQLRDTLRLLRRAIYRIPCISTSGEGCASKVLLAVFAAETTGNPHFFDRGTLGEQLLSAFLKSIYPGTGKTKGRHAEEAARLFYEAGILKDELSNHTLTYGVRGKKRDGMSHPGMEGFLEQKEPLFLTLTTLGSLSQVSAQRGDCVYIVENPAVFFELIRAWPEAAVLCGNGQIRLATLVLMDLFDEKTKFFYAGDFDPEGLQIAQRLKLRYPERMRLWGYRREFYEKYRSNVEITEKSLKKLDQIHLSELEEIKEAIRKTKKAAYQEAMIQEYLTDTDGSSESNGALSAEFGAGIKKDSGISGGKNY